MYRLVLYYLIGLVIVAVIYSAFNLLPYDPINIIYSSLFLVIFSDFVNDLLAKIFDAPTNIESVYITALILVLIINPVKIVADFLFLAWAAVLSMASKYIFTINKKHVFNPAAIAVVLTAFFLKQSASWWVSNLSLLPYVIIGGLLIIRKTQREKVILTFISAAVLTLIAFNLLKGPFSFPSILSRMFFHSSLFFFAFAMLTEPLTMPNTLNLQMIFAAIVGFLFVPNVHVFSIYSTPELALVAGNIFAYFVNPKQKLVIRLKEKIKLTADTYDFIFPLEKKLDFTPGQYMEWTLAHEKADVRGNRRYFTIASSPTENELRIGIKFYEPGSSYKKTMLAMDEKIPIVASQITGDFTLPKDKNKKLVFVAGGIGVTPFRSIIKYLIDTNELRDIIILYSNRYKSEIVYQDIFAEAQIKLGVKTIYTLTDITQVPAEWMGEKGRINEEMIKKEVPDFKERIYYLSGPHNMVVGFEKALKNSGISKKNIKIDFFPGFV